jgi:hypothetical protein
MRTETMLELFVRLVEHLRTEGIGRLVYKAVPHIYHPMPAEEDLYALFLLGARLVRRDVSSTIHLQERAPLAKGRKSGLHRAQRKIEVRRSQDFASFMRIEEAVLLEKYGVRPTHTADELAMLAGRFPENIKLYAAYQGRAMVGGVVVYESSHVAHAQYIATTAAGRLAGALDCIMDELLNTVYTDKRYFDFGISTEDGGRRPNWGLIANKESYGARATVLDFYELDIAA